MIVVGFSIGDCNLSDKFILKDDRYIRFPAIAECVASVLENARIEGDPDLDDIYAADEAAREEALKCSR